MHISVLICLAQKQQFLDLNDLQNGAGILGIEVLAGLVSLSVHNGFIERGSQDDGQSQNGHKQDLRNRAWF